VIVVGFDVSSSAIGWCALVKDQSSPKLLDCGYFKPTKKGSIFDRLHDAETKALAIMNRFKPDVIGIEDIIKYFPHKSSANTIVTLAVFNRTIGLAATRSGYPVQLYNVMAIRHGLKQSKVLPKKEDMPELVSKLLNIQFPYRLNKKKKPVDENLDMADGIAVALFTFKKNQ